MAKSKAHKEKKAGAAARRQAAPHDMPEQASGEVVSATAERQGGSPDHAEHAAQDTSGPERRKSMHDDVRAQREARRQKAGGAEAARVRKGGEAAPAGYVRTSTLWLAVGLALVCGLMVGMLLPTLSHPGLSAGGGGAGGAQSAPAAQEEKTAQLAGHILQLEEAVRKNPEDVAAWVQLGNLYFDARKSMQAINAYERALLLKPDDPDVLTDLGVMYRDVGKFELAVQSFRKASQINPKHQNALFNRGVVLFFDLQRKEEGRKVWQELLVLNPQAKVPDGRLLSDMLRELK